MTFSHLLITQAIVIATIKDRHRKKEIVITVFSTNWIIWHDIHVSVIENNDTFNKQFSKYENTEKSKRHIVSVNLSCILPHLYRRCYRNRHDDNFFDTFCRSVCPCRKCTFHLVWNTHLYSCDDMAYMTNHDCFLDILRKNALYVL